MSWLAVWVFNAFLIQGIYYITYYEYDSAEKISVKRALWWIAYALDWALPWWVTSPLYNCTRCMPTVWGTAVFCGWVSYQQIPVDIMLVVKFACYHLALVGFAYAFEKE